MVRLDGVGWMDVGSVDWVMERGDGEGKRLERSSRRRGLKQNMGQVDAEWQTIRDGFPIPVSSPFRFAAARAA